MLALASVLLVIESCAVPSTGAEKIGGFSLVGTWSGYYKIGSQWGNPEANLKLTIDEVVNDHVKGTWARYLSDSGGYECFNVTYPADGTIEGNRLKLNIHGITGKCPDRYVFITISADHLQGSYSGDAGVPADVVLKKSLFQRSANCDC